MGVTGLIIQYRELLVVKNSQNVHGKALLEMMRTSATPAERLRRAAPHFLTISKQSSPHDSQFNRDSRGIPESRRIPTLRERRCEQRVVPEFARIQARIAANSNPGSLQGVACEMGHSPPVSRVTVTRRSGGPMFAPGILLYVTALRKTNRLPAGYFISLDDLGECLATCLATAELTIHLGDVAPLHTGHGDLWIKDNAAYGAAESSESVRLTRLCHLNQREPYLIRRSSFPNVLRL